MKVLLLVIAFAAVPPVWNTDAAFSVSLELQGGHCSDQLTLICRHSDNILSDPNWIHNGTTESGELLNTAFPGAMYTFPSNTEHRVTISGVGNVTALDGYIIQCVYSIQSNLIKSNAVKYSFIPPDYRPALSLVSFTANFSERLCTFTYSFNESCSLYPRCTPYFSVEHTVSPQSIVSISSSGCSVEYTIHNLMRCVSYQSTATALLSNQRGNPVVVGDTVMLSPGQFTITGVSIGADRNLINVTYMKNESDCPSYPTEWYTVDVDGVQVVNMTADAVQSLAINHTNGSVTLFLPLSQPLPEDAVTLNMTKYNTVSTNRSDVKGNNVTEMVTWGTSAVFELPQESSAAMNDKGGGVGAIISAMTTVVVVIAIAVALVIARKRKAKKVVLGDMGAQPPPPPARTDEISSADFGTEDPCNLITEGTKQAVGAPELESGAGDQEHKGSPFVAPETDPSAESAYVGGDGCKRIRRQPKADLKRGDPAGGDTASGEEPQKTICTFGDDASTGLDHISDDSMLTKCSLGLVYLVQQGQQTTQDLTYVTVDHSQPRPINVPNENLDVQYTGVRFDTEAPAV